MENITLKETEAQGPGSVLEEIARRGAQQMLAQAMEAEVAEFIQRHAGKVDENGHRKVVRNGHMPARELITGIGRVAIKQPRVDDGQLAGGGDGRFSSAILPRYLKRVPSVDSLIPALYLKGVSTGDFSKALQAILGEGAPGLSANSVVRLKAVWEQEYEEWTRRDLSRKRYGYFWAAALPEAGAERGQPDTCTVPEGSVDGGLLEGVAGDPGRRSTGTEREQRGTAEGGVGTGV